MKRVSILVLLITSVSLQAVVMPQIPGMATNTPQECAAACQRLGKQRIPSFFPQCTCASSIQWVRAGISDDCKSVCAATNTPYLIDQSMYRLNAYGSPLVVNCKCGA